MLLITASEIKYFREVVKTMPAANLFASLSPDSIWALFKGTGLLGIGGLVIFLMIKHKVVRYVAVDRGSEWIRAKMGVEQHYRFGKRRGRLVRLKAGGHLLLRGIYDGWEICIREIPLTFSNLSQPFQGHMLQFDRLTISYQVIAPDTPEGDELMLRSFLSVRNTDRDNQKSESLDDKVLAIVFSGLREHLQTVEADDYKLPRLSEDLWIKLVECKLRDKHGVQITSIEWTAPTWLTGQQTYDAGYAIAQALGGQPSSSASNSESDPKPESDNVVDINKPHLA